MSDPTDLIREADAALAQEAANEGGPIVDDPATLVRRLRDALATAQDDNRTLADAYQSEHDRALRLAIRAAEGAAVLAQRDEARAALAEEQVTVHQWRQECRDQLPDLDDNCGPDEVAAAIHMLRVERNNAFAAIRNMQENNLHREAELAEVNATIQHVKDVLDRSSRLVHLDFIRRAIEGES